MKSISLQLSVALDRVLQLARSATQAPHHDAQGAVSPADPPSPLAFPQRASANVEWSRVPLVTSDPFETASAAALRAEGTGMRSDLLGLSLFDLAGFTAYAHRLAPRQ